MTSRKLISKMLEHGFEKIDYNYYGKYLDNGDTQVIVNISVYDSACESYRWFQPHFSILTAFGCESCYSFTASGLNLMLAKRKCFA